LNLNDVIIQEKDRKKQEIKQLKNMKKQEIMDKIDRLKEVTGNQSLGLSLEDLEGDFDPKKHDEIMKVKKCLSLTTKLTIPFIPFVFQEKKQFCFFCCDLF
jgi:hypothetical protein